MVVYIQLEEVVFGRKLGDGGWGVVREGTYKDNKVAIKTINGEFDNELAKREPTFMLQFKDNDYFPKLFGVIKEVERYHLVMELAEGGSLLSVISSQPTTLAQVISWLTQAAKALAELHSRDMLHRDIKSNNMLLDKDHKKLKICDFGFVRKESKDMTQCGTLNYMAPEVFDNTEYTKKCDVYSYGLTMWEVLSGKIPYYDQENLQSSDFFKKVDNGLRPSLEEVRRDCPQSIIDLMKKCWSSSPKHRPTMQEVVNVLSME